MGFIPLAVLGVQLLRAGYKLGDGPQVGRSGCINQPASGVLTITSGLQD